MRCVETVTILTATETTDRYGGTVLDWSDPTSRQVEAICYPTSSSEDNENRSALTVGLTVLFPTATAPTLTHRDRLVARGETWEVDGEIGDWRSPWGWRPGHQVALRRVDG